MPKNSHFLRRRVFGFPRGTAAERGATEGAGGGRTSRELCKHFEAWRQWQLLPRAKETLYTSCVRNGAGNAADDGPRARGRSRQIEDFTKLLMYAEALLIIQPRLLLSKDEMPQKQLCQLVGRRKDLKISKRTARETVKILYPCRAHLETWRAVDAHKNVKLFKHQLQGCPRLMQ